MAQAVAIQYVLTDSRQMIHPPESVFFALEGPHFDGHQFIAACYQAGLRVFVTHQPQQQAYLENFPEGHFLIVDNTTKALQTLAQSHRQRFSFPIIGITGSNGKTIVKEWLWQLLKDHFSVVRSPRSFNSQVGVPLSVLKIENNHTLGIFEAGISRKGEMQALQNIIQASIGIFTNIGSAHDEGFAERHEKVEEKLQLFQNVECLIYCKDYPLIQAAIEQKKLPSFTWSKETGADIWLQSVQYGYSSSTLLIQYKAESIALDIPFKDDASIENIMHCIACLIYLKLPLNGFQQLEQISMRLEIKEGVKDCTIINDSYNNDMQSFMIALNLLVQRSPSEKRVLILSDILESGLEQSDLYQQVAQLIIQKDIQQVIGVGTAIPIIQAFLPRDLQTAFFKTTNDLLKQINDFAWFQHTILVKGARKFGFEHLAARLSKRNHLTVLEVRLQALRHNLAQYRKMLKPSTRVMVMVKAAAYGSGALEVAKLLEQDGVDYLAVAYADEGIELRQEGIQLPILVLNPEEAVIDAMIRYQLEPEVYNIPLLHQFGIATKHLESFSIHLKIDTGMHRLGFEEEELDTLQDALSQYPHFHIKSIFSHLAASEAAEHDTFSVQQIETFQQIYDRLCTSITYQPLRHILNSSGISRFSAFQMDMVRLGIGLYGIGESEKMQAKLQTVLSLKASVSQVKHLPKGETVGYGRRGKANEDKTIATISIGYADGLWRAAGNGRFKVLVRGQLAPTIGNICMDMSMIDVSHIPDVQIGDSVLIFGESLPVTKLAEALQTIPYEILPSISGRVRRVYLQD